MNRTKFLKTAAGTGLIFAAAPLVSFSGQDEEQLDKRVVQEFVGASHKE